MSKPKVVLVAGSGHGGTTIANMVLGQHAEIFATGKLRDFPHGGLFVEANVCSCGSPANECLFWSEVRARYQLIQAEPDPEKIPRLFQIITDLSGRRFIGDVTHNVGYARLLQTLEGIDLYLLHVIRDGRGVVYSRIRKDYRIGRLKKSGWQRLRRVARVSRRWSWHAEQFARLERELGNKALRIHYEDLCRDPATVLGRVGQCLNLDYDPIGRKLGSGEPLQPLPHLIRGNAVLRTSQEIVLRHDTAYRTEMPLLDRITFQITSRLPFVY